MGESGEAHLFSRPCLTPFRGPGAALPAHILRDLNGFAMAERGRQSPGVRVVGAALAIALLPTRSAAAAEPADRPRALNAGAAVSRGLAGGETHDYVFSLDRGQFAEIRVVQRGVDVVLDLLGPDGTVLFAMDTAVGSSGDERACVIASSSGW